MDEIQFIVQRLNDAPFNKGLTASNKLNRADICDLLDDVLAPLKAKCV